MNDLLTRIFHLPREFGSLLRMFGLVFPAVRPRENSSLREQMQQWLRGLEEEASWALDLGSSHFQIMQSVKFTRLERMLRVDIDPGCGPDLVWNLNEPPPPRESWPLFPEHGFEAIFMLNVLEHLEQPWRAAENVSRLAAPGARLYVFVPWIFPHHDRWDYYRFTEQGLKALFSPYGWEITSLRAIPSTSGKPFLKYYFILEGFWNSVPSAPADATENEPAGYACIFRKK